MRKRIIATKTDREWGFVKGDTLEIIRCGDNAVVFAINLTRPALRQEALLYRSEYKFVGSRREPETLSDIKYRVKFLGIPLFSITKGGR